MTPAADDLTMRMPVAVPPPPAFAFPATALTPPAPERSLR